MTDELRFQVLGPLAAFRDDVEIPLGPAKQRAVLAVLLMNAGRRVCRDEIVAGVWGERAPGSAVNLVATYVAGLRRALEPARLIVSAPGGYLLMAGPAQIDLGLFDRDVAAGQFAAALDRWRGPALQGVPGPHADQVRVDLAERRVAVVEQRIEADLERGRHADCVPELLRLVREHPLRESLLGMLMRALHRSGRPAEAMTVFHRARRTLVDELGVEPSAPLRDLYQRVLAEDTVPRQLPADVPDFAGRAAEVARLSGSTGVCVVTGIAGVGKTALAVRAAHAMAHRFPDGQLLVDLRGSQANPLTPDEVLRRLLSDLGVGAMPWDSDQLAALLRTSLSGRRVLLVLDDARDGAQVRAALPGSPGCAVLITSRARVVDLPVGQVLHVEPLDDEAARSVFTSAAGAPRVAAEPDQVDRIVALCSGVPRALRAAGVRLATRPMWTVETLASRMVPEAPAEAARAFRLLGALPGEEIGLHTAAAVLQMTTQQAERTLELLADAHLVEPTATGYRFHPLLHLSARDQAERNEPPSELDALRRRALDFYRAAAYEADLLLRPGRRAQSPGVAVHLPSFRDAAAAIAWWETERANLMGVAAWRPDARLLTDLRSFLHRRGHWDDWETLASAVLLAGRRRSDVGAQAVALLELGTLESVRTRTALAIEHLRGGIRLFREIGDELGEGRALNNIAVVHTNRGEYAEAAASLRQCLRLQRAAGDRDGECITLDNLAMLHVRRKDFGRAEASCERSIRLHEEAGVPSLSTVALSVLGQVHSRHGRHPEAVRTVSRAVRLAHADGNHYREAYALAELGSALHAAGRPHRAVEPLESAMVLQRELRDEFGLAGTLRSLGFALHALGDALAATRYQDEAAHLFVHLDVPA